jgi:hypothetical protein
VRNSSRWQQPAMSLKRHKKGGSVDFREYESSAVVDQFEPLAVALLADAQLQACVSPDTAPSTIDKATLATITANLIQFEEDMLGVNARDV